jgi:hypothetical protein
MAGSSMSAVTGTAGTPLGGIGSGAAKFNASTGRFAICERGGPLQPHDFYRLDSTCFQLYVKRGSAVTTKNPLIGASDDATFPYHRVDFGPQGGVSVKMTGYCPVNFRNYQEMGIPCALYEFTLQNTEATAVDVACALRVETSGTPTLVGGKGFYSTGVMQRGAFAQSDDPSAQVTVGSDNGFFTSGTCSNALSGTLNRTCAKITLAANQTKKVQFVLAWYFTDCDQYYFTTVFANAGAVGQTALTRFTRYRDAVEGFVTRFQASDVPDWFKELLLVSLSPMTTNSIMATNLRMEIGEGQSWSDMGTMDQTWHSRMIQILLMPEMEWKTLEWWAGVQDTDGTMPHDFGKFDWGGCYNYPAMVQPGAGQVLHWVDHQSGFIIGAYEAFVATNNRERLQWFWPYLKKAAAKMLVYLSQDGQPAAYPYTYDNPNRKSTYDAGNADNRVYNSAHLSIAFKLMARLAGWQEPALQTHYDSIAKVSIDSYQRRWLTSGYTGAEYELTAQWLANVLRFDGFYSKASLDYALPLMINANQTIQGWINYGVCHPGGLFLQMGQWNAWRALYHDGLYSRLSNSANSPYAWGLDGIKSPRDMVGSRDNYCVLPVHWRNYFDLTGFYRNAATGEVWLEPILPPEMNHIMTNALFVCPETWGAISCSEMITSSSTTRTLSLKPDSNLVVSTMYVKDTYGPTVKAYVNGSIQNTSRIGTAYSKRVKINWSGTIPPAGIRVEVSDDPGFLPTALSHNRVRTGVATFRGALSGDAYNIRGCRIGALSSMHDSRRGPGGTAPQVYVTKSEQSSTLRVSMRSSQQ